MTDAKKPKEFKIENVKYDAAGNAGDPDYDLGNAVQKPECLFCGDARGIEHPSPCVCQKLDVTDKPSKDNKLAKDVMPDAPREWWVSLEFRPLANPQHFAHRNKPGDAYGPCVLAIEKSAYDKKCEEYCNLFIAYLSSTKRVAELESRIDNYNREYKFDAKAKELAAAKLENQALAKMSLARADELAKAQAEIERLSVTLCDIENESTSRMQRLTQAQARIKDCEDRIENTNGLLRQMEAREQRLVSALDLALYYVEGDATYEGLVQEIKGRFGIDAGKKEHKGG